MRRKINLICFVVLLTVSIIPAFAAVTVTYPAITHSWPDRTADVRDSKAAGSRLWVNTMAGTIYNGDPNDLYSDASPPHQLAQENFNDRAVTETFGIPLDNNTPYTTPYGFTLTHIVIAANGNGSDANQPMSLHIYDLNQVTYHPQDIYYTLLESCGLIPEELCFSDMLPPGDLLSSSATFVFRRDATPNLPHTFVDINFTGYDSFDLEPGHEYAFEIWPTKGDNPGWNWHRDTASYNYPYGLCYRVDPPSDFRYLAAARQAVAAGVCTAVFGVYGIPCDGNAFHPQPRNLETDMPLDTQLRWHSGKWSGPGNDSNHMLYLHTDAFLAQMRDSSARKGRLTDANFTDHNEPNWKSPSNLLPDKWYYWRVDEYNNVKQAGYWGRSTNLTGVWAFKTQSVFAKDPVPINNATKVKFTLADAQLSWTKGCFTADINGHHVYFGTSYNDVNDANTSTAVVYRGEVTDPCYPLSKLVPDYTPFTSGTTYYWRVDEVNSTVPPYVWKGPTWRFTYFEPNTIWGVSDIFFDKGPAGSFDEVSVKDPSIIYSGGKWHLFYTGRDSSMWRMGYASATSIAGLKTATHTFMGSLNGGSYFCAPQVFYFGAKGKWYLIYQSSLGATFSTNTDINDPNGWSAGAAMGITDASSLDFWCVSDDSNVYCFYSPQNGTIRRRSTTVADFPYNWSAYDVACSGTWEASHIYKNIADGSYYMMVEDVSRHFELWTATSLGGTWTQLNENWAAYDNFVDTNEHWTAEVSHGEIIRAGVNERLEITDINDCEILFQGTLGGGGGGGYGSIPYKLGMMRKCRAGPCDIDHDCDCDFEDFAVIGSQWLQWPGVPSADIAPLAGDMIVDMDDLNLLGDYWLLGSRIW